MTIENQIYRPYYPYFVDKSECMDVNIYRKFTKNFNARLSYFNICLNNDVAKVTGDATGIIQSHIGVIELGYKINKKHSLRLELQGLFVNKDKVGNINDKGNWATLLLEYNVSPHWFFSVMDQYNYGNPQRLPKCEKEIKNTVIFESLIL